MQNAQRILITGAASGLGKALALHYAKKGACIALVDINDQRGAETLAEVEKLGGKAFYMHGDVRDEASFERWRAEVKQRWGGLDILINNAGVAAHGAIDVAPLSDWEWIIDINLMSVVRGCKVFIPMFKEQGFGHIVNIASMAGLLHSPEMGSYSVSKAGVVALSETLLVELKLFNVQVSVVCPAFFQTNLVESLRTSDPKASAKVKRLLASSRLDADAVAAAIARGVSGRKFMITPHLTFRTIWYLKRYLPLVYFKMMDRGARATHKKFDRDLEKASKASAGKP